jgi:5-oxoprolinase (ATP-hydrolysing)
LKDLEAFKRWQFWIDRGGTFTDVVARSPDGRIHLHKVLSDNPEHYQTAEIEAIRQIMRLTDKEPLPARRIGSIRMGTTVATNALLTRRGEPTLLVITRGFKDALFIAYQNRPDIFALKIDRPQPLYSHVLEVAERISASGEVLLELDLKQARQGLKEHFDNGLRSCAIVLMHGYKYTQHEEALGKLAREIGFTQVSVSSETAPLIKLVSRGDTTVADAYLSPVIGRHVASLSKQLTDVRLLFMQSNGGLSVADKFRGKDSILSGPAGGIIGAVKTAEVAGFHKIVTFDMGGTSTDVAHYSGKIERSIENEISGARIRAPMISIHTVAAGGGSILHFDGLRYRVGPQSAGARPGPACYRNGGPLTVTDCNLMLGKIQAEHFPRAFGKDGNESIDKEIVEEKFAALTKQIADATKSAVSVEEVASGFLSIAVSKMAKAIKHVSTDKGIDLEDYTLVCFGGAGGQHACLISEALGISKVMIHPYAGILSAYGMGLAEIVVIKELNVEKELSASALGSFSQKVGDLAQAAVADVIAQQVDPRNIYVRYFANVRYEGTDVPLQISWSKRNTLPESIEEAKKVFAEAHLAHYGFVQSDKNLIIGTFFAEAVGKMPNPNANPAPHQSARLAPIETKRVWMKGDWHVTPVFMREFLSPGDQINGPALIVEPYSTIVCEPGWMVDVTPDANLILNRGAKSDGTIFSDSARSSRASEITRGAASTVQTRLQPDPVQLELFNNLFMSVAEQMGLTLQNTSHSVNIKERLDFSCAIFDATGNLIANAPHIPVHLGSMSDSVKHLIATKGKSLKEGDVYAINDPYHGGTHLPDITVITPGFDPKGKVAYFVASRGHHADIGGMTPGSMPPMSKVVDDEGILFDTFQLVKQGTLQEELILKHLATGKFPARNPQQNLADLKAQIAANNRGLQELQRSTEFYGFDVVQGYMDFVQDNAEASVRAVIENLKDGSFSCRMDNGSEIKVKITIDKKKRSAHIDFTGTSAQSPDNFNAPEAVCKAAVLYVFRTLVKDDIPLNEGCLRPLTLTIPDGSLLNPKPPAAVVAGNVETSQQIVDTIYGALRILAASQGTMNNLTFGNDKYQYYETIAGGSGAGSDFDGTDAVQTHMTNSRLTDPEVLEERFPVLVEDFHVKEGSGGAGLHSGGNGVSRKIQFREAMTAAILSGRRRTIPWGIAGGASATAGVNSVVRADGTVEVLEPTAVISLEPGDCVLIETPGGGGFGQPQSQEQRL